MKYLLLSSLVWFGSALATEPTFSALSNEVFSVSCLPCHSAEKRLGDVDLSSYEGLIGSGILVAGNPAQSSLYTETANGRMPLRATRLADDKVEAIRGWIAAGAPNN